MSVWPGAEPVAGERNAEWLANAKARGAALIERARADVEAAARGEALADRLERRLRGE